MEKRIQIVLLAVVLMAGVSLLGDVLPFRISDTAYAYPRYGKNCAACHTSRGSSKGFTDSFMLEECEGFSSTGSNPYFVLEPGHQLILEGEEKKHVIHVTITVLDEEKTISTTEVGDVVTRVVEETESKDGLMSEVSRNYFAICNRTNSVFYFGEDVDIYDKTGTTVVSHEGAWLAGVDDARPGIVMPGVILLGGKYFQEVAPGVAMDRAEIISIKEVVETPKGTFENCLKTRETTPLEPGKEFKFYAPGIGIIKDANLRLTEYTVP